ncbi:E3 ubiquitin-protein ligase HUWE1 [Intoshia linei]|uniref:HECT-type E3 ubiquitin transferase n=1 Tax=Intoshia linei TaxID=1819745 RepID=A0A177B2Q4_9BILA|nr:E3 ubiquitin-protein ligase HUWE1 [Intoshia linei]
MKNDAVGMSLADVPHHLTDFIRELKTLSYEELYIKLTATSKWNFGKYSLYVWLDLLNLFDVLYEKALTKTKNDIIFMDVEGNDSLAKLIEAVIKFTISILENSFYRSVYSSVIYLFELFKSRHSFVVESALQLIFTLAKRSSYLTKLTKQSTIGLLENLILFARPWVFNNKRFTFVECTNPNLPLPPEFNDFRYEYFLDTKKQTTNLLLTDNKPLVIIRKNIHLLNMTHVEIYNSIIKEHDVPKNRLLDLFHQIRYNLYFSNFKERIVLIKCRLLATAIVCNINLENTNYTTDVVSFDFIHELVNVLDIKYVYSAKEIATVESTDICTISATNNISTICKFFDYLSDVKIVVISALCAIIYLSNHSFQSKIIFLLQANYYHGFLPKLVRAVVHDVLNKRDNTIVSLNLSTSLFSLVYHMSNYKYGSEALMESDVVQSILQIIRLSNCENSSDNLNKVIFVTRSVRIIDLITSSPLFDDGEGFIGISEIFLERLNYEVNDNDEDIKKFNEFQKTNKNDTGESFENGCNLRKAALIKTILTFLKKTIQGSTAVDNFGEMVISSSLFDCILAIIKNADYYGASLYLVALEYIQSHIVVFPSHLKNIQEWGLMEAIFESTLNENFPIGGDLSLTLGLFHALCINYDGMVAFTNKNVFKCLIRYLYSSKYIQMFKRFNRIPSMIGQFIDEFVRKENNTVDLMIDEVIIMLKRITVLGNSFKTIVHDAEYKIPNVKSLRDGKQILLNACVPYNVMLHTIDMCSKLESENQTNDFCIFFENMTTFMLALFINSPIAATYIENFCSKGGAKLLLEMIGCSNFSLNYNRLDLSNDFIKLLMNIFVSSKNENYYISSILNSMEKSFTGLERFISRTGDVEQKKNKSWYNTVENSWLTLIKNFTHDKKINISCNDDKVKSCRQKHVERCSESSNRNLYYDCYGLYQPDLNPVYINHGSLKKKEKSTPVLKNIESVINLAHTGFKEMNYISNTDIKESRNLFSKSIKRKLKTLRQPDIIIKNLNFIKDCDSDSILIHSLNNLYMKGTKLPLRLGHDDIFKSISQINTYVKMFDNFISLKKSGSINSTITCKLVNQLSRATGLNIMMRLMQFYKACQYEYVLLLQAFKLINLYAPFEEGLECIIKCDTAETKHDKNVEISNPIPSNLSIDMTDKPFVESKHLNNDSRMYSLLEQKRLKNLLIPNMHETILTEGPNHYKVDLESISKSDDVIMKYLVVYREFLLSTSSNMSVISGFLNSMTDWLNMFKIPVENSSLKDKYFLQQISMSCTIVYCISQVSPSPPKNILFDSYKFINMTGFASLWISVLYNEPLKPCWRMFEQFIFTGSLFKFMVELEKTIYLCNKHLAQFMLLTDKNVISIIPSHIVVYLETCFMFLEFLTDYQSINQSHHQINKELIAHENDRFNDYKNEKALNHHSLFNLKIYLLYVSKQVQPLLQKILSSELIKCSTKLIKYVICIVHNIAVIEMELKLSFCNVEIAVNNPTFVDKMNEELENEYNNLQKYRNPPVYNGCRFHFSIALESIISSILEISKYRKGSFKLDYEAIMKKKLLPLSYEELFGLTIGHISAKQNYNDIVLECIALNKLDLNAIKYPYPVSGIISHVYTNLFTRFPIESVCYVYLAKVYNRLFNLNFAKLSLVVNIISSFYTSCQWLKTKLDDMWKGTERCKILDHLESLSEIKLFTAQTRFLANVFDSSKCCFDISSINKCVKILLEIILLTSQISLAYQLKNEYVWIRFSILLIDTAYKNQIAARRNELFKMRQNNIMGRWYQYDDRNGVTGWFPLRSFLNCIINKHYARGDIICDVRYNDVTYIINFKTMIIAFVHNDEVFLRNIIHFDAQTSKNVVCHRYEDNWNMNDCIEEIKNIQKPIKSDDYISGIFYEKSNIVILLRSMLNFILSPNITPVLLHSILLLIARLTRNRMFIKDFYEMGLYKIILHIPSNARFAGVQELIISILCNALESDDVIYDAIDQKFLASLDDVRVDCRMIHDRLREMAPAIARAPHVILKYLSERLKIPIGTDWSPDALTKLLDPDKFHVTYVKEFVPHPKNRKLDKYGKLVLKDLLNSFISLTNYYVYYRFEYHVFVCHYLNQYILKTKKSYPVPFSPSDSQCKHREFIISTGCIFIFLTNMSRSYSCIVYEILHHVYYPKWHNVSEPCLFLRTLLTEMISIIETDVISSEIVYTSKNLISILGTSSWISIETECEATKIVLSEISSALHNILVTPDSIEKHKQVRNVLDPLSVIMRTIRNGPSDDRCWKNTSCGDVCPSHLSNNMSIFYSFRKMANDIAKIPLQFNLSSSHFADTMIDISSTLQCVISYLHSFNFHTISKTRIDVEKFENDRIQLINDIFKYNEQLNESSNNVPLVPHSIDETYSFIFKNIDVVRANTIKESKPIFKLTLKFPQLTKNCVSKVIKNASTIKKKKSNTFFNPKPNISSNDIEMKHYNEDDLMKGNMAKSDPYVEWSDEMDEDCIYTDNEIDVEINIEEGDVTSSGDDYNTLEMDDSEDAYDVVDRQHDSHGSDCDQSDYENNIQQSNVNSSNQDQDNDTFSSDSHDYLIESQSHSDSGSSVTLNSEDSEMAYDEERFTFDDEDSDWELTEDDADEGENQSENDYVTINTRSESSQESENTISYIHNINQNMTISPRENVINMSRILEINDNISITELENRISQFTSQIGNLNTNEVSNDQLEDQLNIVTNRIFPPYANINRGDIAIGGNNNQRSIANFVGATGSDRKLFNLMFTHRYMDLPSNIAAAAFLKHPDLSDVLFPYANGLTQVIDNGCSQYTHSLLYDIWCKALNVTVGKQDLGTSRIMYSVINNINVTPLQNLVSFDKARHNYFMSIQPSSIMIPASSIDKITAKSLKRYLYSRWCEEFLLLDNNTVYEWLPYITSVLSTHLVKNRNREVSLILRKAHATKFLEDNLELCSDSNKKSVDLPFACRKFHENDANQQMYPAKIVFDTKKDLEKEDSTLFSIKNITKRWDSQTGSTRMQFNRRGYRRQRQRNLPLAPYLLTNDEQMNDLMLMQVSNNDTPSVGLLSAPHLPVSNLILQRHVNNRNRLFMDRQANQRSRDSEFTLTSSLPVNSASLDYMGGEVRPLFAPSCTDDARLIENMNNLPLDVPENIEVEEDEYEEDEEEQEESVPVQESNDPPSADVVDDIDPTFLEALPENLRDEVIRQHGEMLNVHMHASRMRDRQVANRIVGSEFMSALPPNLQQELLTENFTIVSESELPHVSPMQYHNAVESSDPEPTDKPASPVEAATSIFQTGTETNIETESRTDINPVAFLATLAPNLRNSLLLDLDDTLIPYLSNELYKEMVEIRKRVNEDIKISLSDDNAKMLKSLAGSLSMNYSLFLSFFKNFHNDDLANIDAFLKRSKYSFEMCKLKSKVFKVNGFNEEHSCLRFNLKFPLYVNTSNYEIGPHRKTSDLNVPSNYTKSHPPPALNHVSLASFFIVFLNDKFKLHSNAYYNIMKELLYNEKTRYWILRCFSNLIDKCLHSLLSRESDDINLIQNYLNWLNIQVQSDSTYPIGLFDKFDQEIFDSDLKLLEKEVIVYSKSLVITDKNSKAILRSLLNILSEVTIYYNDDILPYFPFSENIGIMKYKNLQLESCTLNGEKTTMCDIWPLWIQLDMITNSADFANFNKNYKNVDKTCRKSHQTVSFTFKGSFFEQLVKLLGFKLVTQDQDILERTIVHIATCTKKYVTLISDRLSLACYIDYYISSRRTFINIIKNKAFMHHLNKYFDETVNVGINSVFINSTLHTHQVAIKFSDKDKLPCMDNLTSSLYLLSLNLLNIPETVFSLSSEYPINIEPSPINEIYIQEIASLLILKIESDTVFNSVRDIFKALAEIEGCRTIIIKTLSKEISILASRVTSELQILYSEADSHIKNEQSHTSSEISKKRPIAPTKSENMEKLLRLFSSSKKKLFKKQVNVLSNKINSINLFTKNFANQGLFLRLISVLVDINELNLVFYTIKKTYTIDDLIQANDDFKAALKIVANESYANVTSFINLNPLINPRILDCINNSPIELSVKLNINEVWIYLGKCLTCFQHLEYNGVAQILEPLLESFFLVHGQTSAKNRSEEISKRDETDSKHRSDQIAQILQETVQYKVTTDQLDESITNSPTPLHGYMEHTSDTDKFIAFADSHRDVLNNILRQRCNEIPISSGPFRVLTYYPRLLDFDIKVDHFFNKLRDFDDVDDEYIDTYHIRVRREYVFEDSYRHLNGKSTADWRKKFCISFKDEEGQDAGGLLREWYDILAKEIFNPNYALFRVTPGDRVTYTINPLSHYNHSHLSYYTFVGRLIAKAVSDRQLLACYFTRSFYKHILSLPIKYTDFETEDNDFYNSLVYVLQNNINELGDDLYFVTETEEFGVMKSVNLKENGANILVTEENKREYIELICRERMIGSIRHQLGAFLLGFFDIIPVEHISIFNEQEIELLISGCPKIDLKDLQNNTQYIHYTEESIQIIWFWEALRSFDASYLAKFLQFVTGTSRVPLHGFAHLEGMNGKQCFRINRDNRSKNRLPVAHTCFNQLDLPEYETFDKLKEYVIKAITECAGFGIA